MKGSRKGNRVFKEILLYLFFVLIFIPLALAQGNSSPHVYIQNGILYIDGVPQSFLYGAEIQYFRARGSCQKNIDPEITYTAWDELLNKAKEAGINTISFYIPWDWHEPVEGKFDFTGEYDGDGDGRPDYPARNLKRFFKMIKEKGFKVVIIRPGPYINAEWGPHFFGAVPEWLTANEEYQDTLMREENGEISISSMGDGEVKIHSYNHEKFLEKVKEWFRALYNNVLKDVIGEGAPLVFIQLDNETNYGWEEHALYRRDYSAHSIEAYRKFLEDKYKDIENLNQVYNTQYQSFSEVRPPSLFDLDWSLLPQIPIRHRDWIEFHDFYIEKYLSTLKNFWEEIDIKEGDVLFIRSEAYNTWGLGHIPGWNGLSSNNGILTAVNLYQKITESPYLLDFPMKPGHDIKWATEVNKLILGEKGWNYVTEMQTGWFWGDLLNSAREHIYVDGIGHGVKGFTFYYFHTGFNEGEASDCRELGLFWKGAPLNFNLQYITLTDSTGVKPWVCGESWSLIKYLGNYVLAPLGEDLIQSEEVENEVAILDYLPYHYSLEGIEISTHLSGALMGLLIAAGYNPRICLLDVASEDELNKYKVLFFHGLNYMKKKDMHKLLNYVKGGGILVNFLDLPSFDDNGNQDDSFSKILVDSSSGPVVMTKGKIQWSLNNSKGEFSYYPSRAWLNFYPLTTGGVYWGLNEDGEDTKGIVPFMWYIEESTGERYLLGYYKEYGKGRIYHIACNLHYLFNEGDYYNPRLGECLEGYYEVTKALLSDMELNRAIEVTSVNGYPGYHVLVWGRVIEDKDTVFIFVRNNSESGAKINVKIMAGALGLDKNKEYKVIDLMYKEENTPYYCYNTVVSNLSMDDKNEISFTVKVEAERATILVIQPVDVPVLGEKQIEKLIEQALQGDIQAIVQLGGLGKVETVEPLLSLLSKPDREIISETRRALIKLMDGIEDEMLKEIVNNAVIIYDLEASKEEKLNAIKQLVQIGDIRGVDALVGALREDDIDIKLTALWGLMKMGDIVVEPLQKYLDDPEISDDVKYLLSQISSTGGIDVEYAEFEVPEAAEDSFCFAPVEENISESPFWEL